MEVLTNSWRHVVDAVKPYLKLVENVPGFQTIRENRIPVILIGGTAVYLFWDMIGWRLYYYGIPPGPVGLPFFGNYREIKILDMQNDFIDISKKYGDIFTFRMFNKRYIVLHSMELMKEAFIKRGAEFSQRPPGIQFMGMDDEIFSRGYSEEWKSNKKFTASALKGQGFGTKVLQDTILNEIGRISEELRKVSPSGEDPIEILNCAAAAIILKVLINKSVPTYGDQEFLRYRKVFYEFSENFEEGLAWDSLPRWVAYLTGGDLFKRCEMRYKNAYALIKQDLDYHKETFDPDNIRDFMDTYLAGRPDISDRVLIDTVLIFTPDSCHTWVTMMRYTFLFLGTFQDIQEKIYQEILREVGKDRKVTSEDRVNMPYTHAFCTEAQRFCPVIPLTPYRCAPKTTTLGGYKIPKEFIIIGNYYALNFDERVHGPDVKSFKPERWLDENVKVQNLHKIATFGIGSRNCMGELLAKQEQWLFVANLCQTFKFTFPEDQPNPTLEPLKNTLVTEPHPYRICATSR